MAISVCQRAIAARTVMLTRTSGSIHHWCSSVSVSSRFRGSAGVHARRVTFIRNGPFVRIMLSYLNRFRAKRYIQGTISKMAVHMIDTRVSTMRFLSYLAVACLLGVLMTGCVRLPLVSHAHVGHALTAWGDTPNQEGLFVVAEKETKTAFKAVLSAQTDQTLEKAQRHIGTVIHALNPDLHLQGAGLGYGAIRALGGVIDHINFAAQSDDASQNVINSAATFSVHARPVLDRLKLAAETARLAERSRGTEFAGLTEELQGMLDQCLHGADLDGDGIIGGTPEEFGLTQLRNEISVMLRSEDPPYHPLGRKYVLGLIRLPNGQWAYKFDRSGGQLASGY